ncbi:MAG: Kelch repeat-containing protein, partial [Sandaracinaceae bacterium]
MRHRFSRTALALVASLALACGGTASPDAGLADAGILDAGTDAGPPVDPSAWTETGALQVARAHATATRLDDGRVIVVGGHDAALTMLDSVEIYDPSDGAFHPAARLPEPRAYHSATLLADGRLLVVGGGPGSAISIPTGEAPMASALLYDPALDTWTETGSLHEARAGHGAVGLPDGRVLVAGGGAGVGYPCASSHPDCTVATSLASAELYDLVAGAWTIAPPMTQARLAFTLTVLSTGRVIAAGGAAENRGLASAEIFDPASGAWTATEGMGTARLYHAASLLPDGTLLVVGGKIANVAPIGEATRFDESQGTWTPTEALSPPRTGAALVTLASGRALLVGGNDQLGVAHLPDALLFDPAV